MLETTRVLELIEMITQRVKETRWCETVAPLTTASCQTRKNVWEEKRQQNPLSDREVIVKRGKYDETCTSLDMSPLTPRWEVIRKSETEKIQREETNEQSLFCNFNAHVVHASRPHQPVQQWDSETEVGHWKHTLPRMALGRCLSLVFSVRPLSDAVSPC